MASTPELAPPGDYDAAYYAAREGWADRRIESAAAVRALGRLPGPMVLDIGCGSGPLFPLLAQRGFTPVGVETNRTAAQAAQARGSGGVVLVGEGPALPFRAGAAGGIVAQHLIEHLEQPLAALREWRRVLQPGGRAVLLTPNDRHPDPALFADPDHTALFTAARLAALLRSAGFADVQVGALFPYLGRGRLGRGLSRRLWAAGQWPPWSARARTLLATAVRPGSEGRWP